MNQQPFSFRAARKTDLSAIVRLLADDDLGQSRENPTLPLAGAYLDAFQAIADDANQILAVATNPENAVIGTIQITLIPGISRRGAWRGQIEAVRVARDYRGSGLGQSMLEWAITQCRLKGCSLIQLTTDKSRPDAHRFYEKLGFEASHLGYKLNL
ncbi:MAG: GNAT family N-acetyltransferase [Rhodospirillales bacterium]|nr:GNAT family N-acetyltransferase [Rhodospirillales bacterium]